MHPDCSSRATPYAAEVARELERLFRGNPAALPLRGESGGYFPRRWPCPLCEDRPTSVCAAELADEEAEGAPPEERARVEREALVRAKQGHDAPSTLDDWIAHVRGAHFRGSYTVSPGGVTDVIAHDLDAHGDPQGLRFRPHARYLALAASVRALGVERAFVGNTSRGGTGRHARLCVARDTPAWLARRIGEALLEHAGITPEPEDGTPAHAAWLARFGENPDGGAEVFPKQVHGHGYGNLLAAPCSRPLYEKGRTALLTPEGTVVPWEAVLATLRAVKPLSLAEVYALARRLGVDPEAPEDVRPQSSATAVREWGGRTGTGAGGAQSPYTQAVLGRVDMAQTLDWLGLPRPGPNGRMTCPLHTGSQHPDTLSVRHDSFRCFSSRCERGGSPIHFVAAYLGLAYRDAREWLAERAGLRAPAYFEEPSSAHPTVDPRTAMRETLTTPGAALLDRRPPGRGKSTDACYVVAALEDGGRTLVLAPRHDHHARELLPRIQEAAEARGGPGLVAQWPRPVCPIGRTEEIQAASRAGYNYARTVCGGCWRSTHELARRHGVPYCTLRAAQEHARDARVLLVQHAHLTAGDALWTGIGEGARRVVIDEDAVARLARDMPVTTETLERYLAVLAAVRRQAERDLEHEVLDLDTGELEVRRAEADERDLVHAAGRVVGGYRAFQAAVAKALTREGLVLAVDAPAAGAWRHLLTPRDVKVVARAVEGSLAGERRPPTNLLPLAVHAARTWEGGESLVLLRAQPDAQTEAVGLVPAAIPDDLSVVLLDATGSPPVLERLLGRPIQTVEGEPPTELEVLQMVTGGNRSRAQLKLRADLLQRDARLIVRRIVQGGLGRGDVVGLISYKRTVEPLRKLVWEGLRARRNRGQTMPKLRTLYWHASRGTNDLKGAALVVIHGCPTPNPLAVRRLALLLGASPEELQEKSRLRVVDVDGTRCQVRTYEGALMERARRALVDAELVQGLGRATRGDEVPQAGVLALTSYPLAYGRVRRQTAREAGLAEDTGGASDTSASPRVTNRLSSAKCQPTGRSGVMGDSAQYSTNGSDTSSPSPLPAPVTAGAAPPPATIRALVEQLGLEEVARAAGASTRSVRRWSQGRSRPRRAHAERLRNLLTPRAAPAGPKDDPGTTEVKTEGLVPRRRAASPSSAPPSASRELRWLRW